MRIKELFKSKELVYSFEIFPPKVCYPLDSIYQTIEKLSILKPDYISVTYGAGGSVKNNRTVLLSHLIKEQYNIESLAHLTCIGASKADIEEILQDLTQNDITNILALRGDIGKIGLKDFRNSQELITEIKKTNNFGIAAACYPEGHLESGKDVVKDIHILKLKEAAGADYFISQLFLDNSFFYEFKNKARAKNVQAPLSAGIMPIINSKQAKHIVSLCGITIPKRFLQLVEKYEHDKVAFRDAGIDYALNQILDLIEQKVEGIHLYTMNNPYLAKTITNTIQEHL